MVFFFRTPTTICVKKIYETELQSDKTDIDVIPWNPIDDMELTPMHEKAKILPCAFPFWKKVENKNGADSAKNEFLPTMLKNDRAQLVNRAVRKTALKQEFLAQKCAKQLKNKKKKRQRVKTEKNKMKKLLKKEENEHSETIDPYVVFDAKGNISISELMTSSRPSTTSQTKEVPMDFSYNDYLREATTSIEEK